MSTKRGLPDDDDPLGSVLGPADTNEKAAPKHEADDEKPRKPGAVRRVVKRAKVAVGGRIWLEKAGPSEGIDARERGRRDAGRRARAPEADHVHAA